MYKIIGGDGKEYGPVSVEQLRQWVMQGRANAQSQVRAEGASDWQALGALPELAATFNAPPTLPRTATGAIPGAIHDGDYELDILGCLSRAWDVLTTNFGSLVGAGAIYLFIIGGLSVFAQIPFIGMLFSMLSLVVTGPLVGGVYIYFLRVIRKQPAGFGEIFSGFRDNLGQYILGYLIPALITGACAIPGIIMTAVPIIIMVNQDAASAGLIALAFMGLILALTPVLYLSTCWAFTLPLIADRRLDFWPAMKTSRAQVRRHWWTLFGLFMLMGVINCVGLLLCCVGAFVTLPLMFVAMLLAYEIIFLPRTAQPGTGA